MPGWAESMVRTATRKGPVTLANGREKDGEGKRGRGGFTTHSGLALR